MVVVAPNELRPPRPERSEGGYRVPVVVGGGVKGKHPTMMPAARGAMFGSEGPTRLDGQSGEASPGESDHLCGPPKSEGFHGSSKRLKHTQPALGHPVGAGVCVRCLAVRAYCGTSTWRVCAR